jgi:DNA-binding transcriptional regulator YhcF (GntR family)
LASGERLPSQIELADYFQVARETVKSALRILRDERLVVSRQGSGAFVRSQMERPVGLRPHVEEAFERSNVTVDFAGFSGETLHGALAEPLDKIRAGRLTTESLRVRILIPDTSVPMAFPVDAKSGNDLPAARDRAERIMRRHTEAIVESVHELGSLGLIKHASAAVRSYRATPLFKLYVLNQEEAFFGFYPVVEHSVNIKGSQVAIFDVLGKDSVLFHYSSGDDESGNETAYVQQAALWFDSLWSNVAKDVEL